MCNGENKTGKRSQDASVYISVCLCVLREQFKIGWLVKTFLQK